jgi:hypothetical protein
MSERWVVIESGSGARYFDSEPAAVSFAKDRLFTFRAEATVMHDGWDSYPGRLAKSITVSKVAYEVRQCDERPPTATQEAAGFAGQCDFQLFPLEEPEAVLQWVIVNTDNWGGDYPNEKFLKDGSTTSSSSRLTTDPEEAHKWADKSVAKGVADAINKRNGEMASRYYKVESVGYELQPGFEP